MTLFLQNLQPFLWCNLQLQVMKLFITQLQPAIFLWSLSLHFWFPLVRKVFTWREPLSLSGRDRASYRMSKAGSIFKWHWSKRVISASRLPNWDPGICSRQLVASPFFCHAIQSQPPLHFEEVESIGFGMKTLFHNEVQKFSVRKIFISLMHTYNSLPFFRTEFNPIPFRILARIYLAQRHIIFVCGSAQEDVFQ